NRVTGPDVRQRGRHAVDVDGLVDLAALVVREPRVRDPDDGRVVRAAVDRGVHRSDVRGAGAPRHAVPVGAVAGRVDPALVVRLAPGEADRADVVAGRPAPQHRAGADRVVTRRPRGGAVVRLHLFR